MDKNQQFQLELTPKEAKQVQAYLASLHVPENNGCEYAIDTRILKEAFVKIQEQLFNQLADLAELARLDYGN